MVKEEREAAAHFVAWGYGYSVVALILLEAPSRRRLEGYTINRQSLTAK